MRIRFWVVTLLLASLALSQAGTPEERDLPDEMHRALYEHDLPAVQALLRLDGTLVDQAWHGITPLLMALSDSRDDDALLAELLAAGANPNLAGRWCHSNWPEFPLHAATWNRDGGAPRRLRRLLRVGAHLNRRTAEGTALVLAARRGDLASVNVLLDAGADPESTDAEGLTPLHWAARHSKPLVMSRLLRRGVRVDRPTSLGTALGLASRSDLEAMELLLQAGADPNFSAPDGWTPLHCAARFGTPEMVSRLLAAGADPRRRDSRGQTPLEVAAEVNHRAVVACLVSRGRHRGSSVLMTGDRVF